VLQVVEGSTTTNATNSTSTYADTNLTATITPTLATSKVLVFFSQNGCLKSGGTTNSLAIRLLRGATQLTQQTQGNGSNINSFLGSYSNSVLDTPATTSATTYKTQLASTDNSNSVEVQATTAGYTSRSSIILMEIGA
jgi:hypothetical protein